jgi:hypothetical protein
MKCKHGQNTHKNVESWVACVLGNEYHYENTGIFDAYNKPHHRHYYKQKEYSWKEILRLCELKAFL